MMSKTDNPRDFHIISQGEGWIVRSTSTDWAIGSNGSHHWFQTQDEAQEAADQWNNYVGKREFITRELTKLFRRGR